jgi:ABC-type transport system involved in Fe-S cluster assembly, permease component
METYPETLKTRLNDEAFEFRRDSFLAFLKTPIRSFKESPTVSEYVEVTDKDLERMLYGEFSQSPRNPQFIKEANIKVLNGKLESVENLPQGVEVMDLVEAARDSVIRSRFLDNKHLGDDRTEFLINSAWQRGLFVKVGKNVKADITVHNLSNGTDSYAYKTVVSCGEESKLNYTEVNESASDGDAVQGKNIYFFQDEYSKVQFNYVQDKSLSVTDLSFVKSFQSRYTEFQIFHINHGGSRVIFGNESQQIGDSSDYRVYGVSFSDAKQKIDIRDSSFQVGKSSTADIHVRGVVKGTSSTIHRGNIDLEFEAVNATGFYDSKILLLSKEGYANSKPGLMIKNSNTKSKHGSAISNVNEDEIVYLRSRGIDENTARSMITEGFVSYVIEKSNSEFMNNRIKKYTEGTVLGTMGKD